MSDVARKTVNHIDKKSIPEKLEKKRVGKLRG